MLGSFLSKPSLWLINEGDLCDLGPWNEGPNVKH